MEFFVGNLIVAGLSDWGCVLIPTGLPAELIPHIFSLCPATCVIIPAAPPFVNLFCKVFSVNWTVQAHRPGTAPSTQNSASRRQALPEGCAVIFCSGYCLCLEPKRYSLPSRMRWILARCIQMTMPPMMAAPTTQTMRSSAAKPLSRP